MRKLFNSYSLVILGGLSLSAYYISPDIFTVGSSSASSEEAFASEAHHTRASVPDLPAVKSVKLASASDSENKVKHKQDLNEWQKTYVGEQTKLAVKRRDVASLNSKSVKRVPLKKQTNRPSSMKNDASKQRADILSHQNSHKEAAATSQKLANPMAKRWISSLSGTKAQINLENHKPDTKGCPPDSEECASRNAKPDHISVFGVVVDSGKLEKSEAADSSVIEGKVQQGNYAEGTPAVYVQ